MPPAGITGAASISIGKTDSTSEFRRYMLNRGRRRRRMENFLFGTLVCVAVLLGLFLVSVYLLGI